MKYFIMNQKFTKLLLFHVFRGLHQFIFLKICIYANKATLLVFEWKKYTAISICFYYFFNNYLILLFCFSRGITNMVQVTVPAVVANNLQTSLPVHLLAYKSAVAH